MRQAATRRRPWLAAASKTIGQRSIGPATPAAIFRREPEPLAEVLRELFASNHAGWPSASSFAARLSRLVLLL